MFKRITKHKRSILYTWFLSYLCVLLVPILMGVYLYHSAYGEIQKTSRAVYKAALDQIALELDSQVREAQAIISQLLGDEDVQRLSSQKGAFSADGQFWSISLNNRLQKLVMSHPGIEDIYVIFTECDEVLSIKGLMNHDLFCQLYLGEYGTSFAEGADPEAQLSHFLDELNANRTVCLVTLQDGREKILFHKKTLDTGLGHSTARIVIQVDKASLMQHLSAGEETVFVVSDEDGKVLASTGDVPPGDTAHWETISKPSSVINWNYAYRISTALYKKSASTIQIRTMLGLLLCTILGIFLAVRMSRRNYNPIKNLLELTDKGKTSPLDGGNEYQLLEDRVSDLYHESKTMNHALYRNSQAIRNLRVFSLLSGNGVYGEDSLQDGLGYTVVLFDDPYFDLQSPYPEEQEKQSDLLKSVVINIFEEIAGAHFGVMSTTEGFGCASIVTLRRDLYQAERGQRDGQNDGHSDGQDGDDIRNGMQNAQDDWMGTLSADIRKVQEIIEENLHLGLHASVGTLHKEPEGIHLAYLEAKEAIEFAGGDAERSEIVFYGEICDKRGNYALSTEAESLLIQYVSVGNEDSARAIIEEIIQTNTDQQGITQGARRYLYMELALDIIRGGKLSGIDGFSDEDLIAIRDNADKHLEEHLFGLLSTITAQVKDKKNEKRAGEKFCREVVEYIDSHYRDPDLNISQAALHFDITPSYLSGLFKKETGKSLLAYISEVRTEAAKKLLLEEHTIAEVAEQAGFRDSAALIRTFKKNVGITPGQFRENSFS
ncbi:MAG: AraC family transcriptional regulator [Lachnospiraceae bacterium]|nr:AraC family transcriptional regulator [Lachnospiraceae bacterium]